jgi:hypothetical protein
MSASMESRRERAPGSRLENSRNRTLLVLALFALGWFADRTHLALVSHTYCAQHQQVEHQQIAHAAPGSACSRRDDAADDHVDSLRRNDARGPVVDAAASGENEHEACCVPMGRGESRVAVTAPSSPAFLAAHVERARIPLRWGTHPLAAIDTVSVAPKQSPPAA